MLRHLAYLLPTGLFVLLLAGFFLGLGRNSAVLPTPLIDQPAPNFSLPPLDKGQSGFSSADLKGHVSVVNTFASWCAPCREENPALMALARTGRVAVYGIDYKDNPKTAAAWLAELGNPYSRIGADDGRVGIAWGVYGVPETFVVDRNGRIRHKHVGVLTEAEVESTILPLVKRLEQ
jgi:cytochrome c biogenesis protein CcmG/thiol:disulfide interchange protein DsbE